MDQFALGFVTQDLDQSVKSFPVLRNVPLALVPELEKEIYNSTKLTRDSSLKATEQTLKTIQKGIASSINALGPLAEVIMKQSRDNEELDAVSPALLDVIKLLTNSFNGISKKRRDLLRPHIDVKYQKFGKKCDDDHDHKFLFGGNLSQRVNEVKASNSLMKEVMKPEPKPSASNQPKRHQHNNASGRTNGQNSGQRSTNRPAPYNRNNNGAQTSKSNTDFRKTGSSGNSGGHKRS